MSQTDSRPIRFGAFELNPDVGELRKGGIRLKLAEQPFRILHYLAGRPGEVVTREELRKLLWGEDTFVDVDHGLNASINKIREALGDSAATPRFIETVPRRGYRFVGEITPPDIALPPPIPLSHPVEAPWWKSNLAPWAGAGVLLVIGAGAAWWATSRQHATPQLTMRPLTADAGLTTHPVLSRDGRLVSYASDRATGKNLDIWVHPLTEGGQPIRITHNETDDKSPDFSPDGGLIVFRSERDGGGIYVVPALGGEERLLVRGGIWPRFSPDGKSVAYCVGGRFEVPSKIFSIPVSGGIPKELAPDVLWACAPVYSQDGQYILFDGSVAPNDPWHDWWVTPVAGGASAKTGSFTILNEQFKMQRPFSYWADLAEGKGLFSFDGRIWALDLAGPDWKARGPARPLTSGSSVSYVRASAGSPLVFVNQQFYFHLWKVRIDPKTGRALGEMQPLPHAGGSQYHPSLSDDGRKLVFSQKDPSGCAIRLRHVTTSKETTLAKPCSNRPKISPDGKRVAYSIFPDTIYVVSADGGEPTQLVAPREKGSTQVFGWSPDGKKIVYWYGDPVRYALLDPDTRQSTVFLQHPKNPVYTAQLSPDQSWVAFTMPMGRKSPLWIAPLRDGKALGEETWIPVSQDLDMRPWWSPNGNILYMESRRDGFLCIWAQPLDPATKRPRGEAFAVQHVHAGRVKLTADSYFGPALLPDTLIFAVQEESGNVWIAKP